MIIRVFSIFRATGKDRHRGVIQMIVMDLGLARLILDLRALIMIIGVETKDKRWETVIRSGRTGMKITKKLLRTNLSKYL